MEDGPEANEVREGEGDLIRRHATLFLVRGERTWYVVTPQPPVVQVLRALCKKEEERGRKREKEEEIKG